MKTQPPSLLVTGASGFVGSHLVETALNSGFNVWAAVRQTSSRQYLTDPRVQIIELDINKRASLQKQIGSFVQQHNCCGWDYVIHAAGATKARSEEEFVISNYETTRILVETLHQQRALPRRFVLMSSLGAVLMKNGHPAGNKAVSAYGRSKLMAEDFLKKSDIGLDFVILRPTGVYGPREKDYFLMVKSIKRHIDFMVGKKTQQITFIYVKDLCKATLSALVKGVAGKTYQLSDGHTYESRDFSNLIKKELGNPWVARVTVSLALLKIICYASEWLSHLTHRMTAINKDKYNILKQRDWRCDITAAQADLQYMAEYDLGRGVAETISWYKKEKWI